MFRLVLSCKKILYSVFNLSTDQKNIGKKLSISKSKFSTKRQLKPSQKIKDKRRDELDKTEKRKRKLNPKYDNT